MLIDNLSRTSAYSQAVADDEELADQFPDTSDERPSPPPLRDWSPEVELLAAMVDRLAEVVNTQIAAAGGKPSRVQPWPRPVLAIDRVRARRRREAGDSIESKLFPPKEA